MAKTFLLKPLSLALMAAMIACTPESSAPVEEEVVVVTEVPEIEDDSTALKREVVENYAKIVYANYEDAVEGAKRLLESVQNLVVNPSEATLDKARETWKAARIPYLQTEVYRFYGGPIDDEESGVEGLLNAWPLDEAYLDYVRGSDSLGIIGDTANHPEITRERIVEWNEQEGETNISAGFHAVEFLLWGQDHSADGPGDRPFTDYVPTEENPIAARRGRYLIASSELILEHLQGLVSAWSPGGENHYRVEFLSLPPREALGKIFTGFVTLAGFELLGERLVVPYETQAQEDEQSCFSDNTHVDIIENARALQNVWLGRYQRTDGSMVQGPGLQAIVAAVDEPLADTIRLQIDGVIKGAEAIPAPFDQAILGNDTTPGRVAIAALIERLEMLSESILAAIEVTGLDASIAEGGGH
jgi:putative iron-regulated protein